MYNVTYYILSIVLETSDGRCQIDILLYQPGHIINNKRGNYNNNIVPIYDVIYSLIAYLTTDNNAYRR